jgi:hypothetical protein
LQYSAKKCENFAAEEVNAFGRSNQMLNSEARNITKQTK